MKFGGMQKQLEKMGYEAVNPLEVVGTWQVTWQQAMKLCIKALVGCDAVLALDDYTQSRGAKIELDIAEEMGMPIFFSIEELTAHKEVCPHKVLGIKVVHSCVTCETLATVCQGCKKQIGETKTEC
jgi:hypothetical protein